MNNEYYTSGNKAIIRLKNNLITSIDLEDLKRVKEFNGKWFGWWSKFTESYYVRGCTHFKNGERQSTLLHRWIMQPPKHLVINHNNHDTLNNRRSNLRIVTKAQNNLNKKTVSRNKILVIEE